MSSKQSTTSYEMEAIARTLDARDPHGETVSVGTAAVIAQFYELGLESPVSCDDVDVLCSLPYFERLLAEGPHLEGISKFQVRWPKGRLAIRGATNKSIDIFHDDLNLLKFTACYSMSDRYYQIDYDSCQDMVVEAGGIRCLKLGTILGWLAIIGRDKDMSMVQTVLPLAREAALIDAEQEATIQEEWRKSEIARIEHPERYYARRDDRLKV